MSDVAILVCRNQRQKRSVLMLNAVIRIHYQWIRQMV